MAEIKSAEITKYEKLNNARFRLTVTYYDAESGGDIVEENDIFDVSCSKTDLSDADSEIKKAVQARIAEKNAYIANSVVDSAVSSLKNKRISAT